jgi:xanthine dehydrogenase accessory factor
MEVDGDDVLGKALEWLDDGRRVALATVVETWGSSPRPRGSQLVVRDDGLFIGSVSGGCVEGKVVEAAQTAMDDRAHRLLEFGVSNQEAWEVGLACGGTVRIYVEPVGGSAPTLGPLGRDVLEAVRRARAEKRALVLVTPLDGGAVRAWTAGDPPLAKDLQAAADRALATDDAVSVETAGGAVFVQAINPPLKLVIVGAVHIAEPLARIASLLGYQVTLIDPREAFARAERWPGITVATDWPDEVMGAMALDHRTAIVALTHDPKIDDPALEAALKSNAFYIGALGSGKTHGSRLRRLGARGWDAAALARIHGPVGLKIGARSPGEIAVSIAAQMTDALRRAPAADSPAAALP